MANCYPSATGELIYIEIYKMFAKGIYVFIKLRFIA